MSSIRPYRWEPLDERAPKIAAMFNRSKAEVDAWEPAPCPPRMVVIVDQPDHEPEPPRKRGWFR